MAGRASARRFPPGLVLGAAGFCASISWQIVVPFLPLRLAHIGYAPAQIGLLIGLYSLTMALVELQAGTLVAAAGRRWALLGGYAANALCLAVLAAAGTRAVVAAALPAVGAARGAIFPPLHATVADSTTVESRGRAFGTFWACTAFAALAGPAIGGLAAGRYGDGAPFALAGLFSLAALPIIAAKAAPRQRTIAGRPSIADLTAFLAQPAVALLGGAILLWYSVAGIWTTFLPLYASRHGVPVVTIGWMFTAQGCAYVLMQVPTGRLITGPRGRWMAAVGIAGASSAALCVPLLHAALFFFAAALLYGASTGLLPVTFSTLLTWHAPAARYTTAMSVYNSAIDFGLFAGPLLGAAVSAAAQNVAAPFLLALPLGLAAVLMSVQPVHAAPAAAPASQ
jgi:MFS family permease